MTERNYSVTVPLTSGEARMLDRLAHVMGETPTEAVAALIRDGFARKIRARSKDAERTVLLQILRHQPVTKREIQRGAPRPIRSDAALLEKVLESLILNGHVRAERRPGLKSYTYVTTARTLYEAESQLAHRHQLSDVVDGLPSCRPETEQEGK